ncbi:hypothetical protein QJS10_CPA07g00560 [Acorus calamus]|uniref:Reverse transcriptase zinc-binding domain-containing protein n=1 Tax=Acorus calamus TaxID=4465 RepID=A0AAV9EFL7_ACOCL|nr:hypothetical protein QJS10_CPA07g00560 [Acorus calamus]
MHAEEVASLRFLLLELRVISLRESVEDTVGWKIHPNLPFSVSRCYDWLRSDRIPCEVTARKFNEVWRTKAPLKVHVFLWMMFQDKLLTKVYRAKWSDDDPRCPICLGGQETSEHIMIHCSTAQQIWGIMRSVCGMPTNFHTLEELWAAGKHLKHPQDNSVKAKVTQLFVPAVTWALWLARNHFLFRGMKVYIENVWEMVTHLIREWGLYCVGASKICFQSGVLLVEE